MNTDIEKAEQSLKEEERAVEDYHTRMAHAKSKELRKIYDHLIDEENEHASMLGSWLADQDKSYRSEAAGAVVHPEGGDKK